VLAQDGSLRLANRSRSRPPPPWQFPGVVPAPSGSGSSRELRPGRGWISTGILRVRPNLRVRIRGGAASPNDSCTPASSRQGFAAVLHGVKTGWRAVNVLAAVSGPIGGSAPAPGCPDHCGR
jgi:hypothetical protein